MKTEKQLTDRLAFIGEDILEIENYLTRYGFDIRDERDGGISIGTYLHNVCKAVDLSDSIVEEWTLDANKEACLNCGEMNSGVIADSLGAHIVCRHCGSSYDSQNAPSSINSTAITSNLNNAQHVDEIIAKLRAIGVDGETMEYIVEQAGLSDQLHRQYVVSKYPAQATEELLDEKRDLEAGASGKKGFWQDVYNTEFHLKATAKKVWDDLQNNDHLIYSDFDSYYNSLNK